MSKRVSHALFFVSLAFVVVAPAASFANVSHSRFLRGDVQMDGRHNLLDAVVLLNGLFSAQSSGVSACEDAADVDDNGVLELADALSLLNFLFLQGNAPPVPFESCDRDTTLDGLRCEEFTHCEIPVFGLPIPPASAVVFVLDRSGSMQAQGKLDVAKARVSKAIRSIPEDAELGVVFADGGILRFPDSGTVGAANTSNLLAGSGFVEAVPGGGGGCIRDGLLTAFDMLRDAQSANKLVVLITDGETACRGLVRPDVWSSYLFETIREANTVDATVHAVGVLEISASAESSLRQLAGENGGRFALLED